MGGAKKDDIMLELYQRVAKKSLQGGFEIQFCLVQNPGCAKAYEWINGRLDALPP